MTSPVLVFDLDGTLADTSRDLVPVLNRAIASQGLPPIALGDIGCFIGHGARAMIEQVYAYHGALLAPEVHNTLFDAFLADYEANIAVNTIMYDGAVAALEHFGTAGWTLAVCTNKPERLALKLLDKLGVLQRFACVTGGDSFAFRKPDPRHLTQTITLAGAMPENAIMVGDSRTDIDTAKAAGIPVIAVDFGYTDTPVTLLSPDRVISHFSELAEAIRQLQLR